MPDSLKEMGGGGADVGPLKITGAVLAGLRQIPSSILIHHHASNGNNLR
jgi:hypothetical protein